MKCTIIVQLFALVAKIDTSLLSECSDGKLSDFQTILHQVASWLTLVWKHQNQS